MSFKTRPQYIKSFTISFKTSVNLSTGDFISREALIPSYLSFPRNSNPALQPIRYIPRRVLQKKKFISRSSIRSSCAIKGSVRPDELGVETLYNRAVIAWDIDD